MKSVIAPLLVILASAAAGHAAVLLSGTVNTNPGHTTAETAIDLTATGTLNWAAWDSRTNANPSTPRPATNTLGPALAPGTPGYISPLTGVGGTTGNLQGSSTLGAAFFNYTNGAVTTSLGAPSKFGTAFNSTLDLPGTGMSLTVAGDPQNIYRVSVWASGFNGQGTLVASLNGATSLSLVTQTFGNGKAPVLFTIEFRPENASDLLNLSYTLTTDTPNSPSPSTVGSNSHVAIQAVTVEVIPEASSAAVLMGGLLMLGCVRRRA